MRLGSWLTNRNKIFLVVLVTRTMALVRKQPPQKDGN